MITETKLIINTCKQCGWEWAQHRIRKINAVPLTCPKCYSKYWNSEDLKKCMKLWKEETGIQDDDQAYFRERLPIEISEYPSLKPQEYHCRQVMVWKK